MNTSKQISHQQVEGLLLDVAEILERSGAHFVVTRELAKKLKNWEWFEGIDKIRIVAPTDFIRDKYAKDIMLTLLQKYNAEIIDDRINFEYDGINVTIKFVEQLHKTLVDPDYVNVLGEKIPVPNPWPEYIKVQNFI